MIYQITTGTYHLQGENYRSYGIRCAEFEVGDISTDKAEVEALVELCNSGGLEPIHLLNVIEDFLAAPEMVLSPHQIRKTFLLLSHSGCSGI